MVNLILIRHGEALSPEIDSKRPLSELGKKQAEKTGKILSDLGLKPKRIIHSGKLRAKQTAEIIANIIAKDISLEEEKGLSPNDPVDPIAHELRNMDIETMIVGHLPFMGNLLSLLLTGDEGLLKAEFTPAAAAWIKKEDTGFILKAFILP